MKLKFDGLTLGQFKFKTVPKKRVVKYKENKRLTKLVEGICILQNNEFKVQINASTIKPSIEESAIPDVLMLPFTEESYNLKGVISVFSKCVNERGLFTRYIRNIDKCRIFPGDPDKLVPFCHNWICSGYVTRRDGKLMFEFNECIKPKGYNTFINEDDE